jgi:uncharacterized protein (DUF302 family)
MPHYIPLSHRSAKKPVTLACKHHVIKSVLARQIFLTGDFMPIHTLSNRITCVTAALCLFVISLGAVAQSAAGAEGLITVVSALSAKATMDKLEAIVKERGLNVFARIDHAAGAARVNKTLAPTELLIFGNPQGGTPLMECAQTAGIDLPLKALVWQDATGKVMLSYNDPAYLAKRHNAANCTVVPNLQKALEGLAAAATTP